MKKYIAESGIIREVNPYGLIPCDSFNPDIPCLNEKECNCRLFDKFQNTVQSYPTDLPDGEYSEGSLKFNFQVFNWQGNSKWVVVLPLTEVGYKNMGYETRQFVTAKPKEEKPPENNASIYKWLSKQKYQTERNETGEYLLFYELDMPKILKDYTDYADFIPRQKVIEAIEKRRIEALKHSRKSEVSDVVERELYDLIEQIEQLK